MSGPEARQAAAELDRLLSEEKSELRSARAMTDSKIAVRASQAPRLDTSKDEAMRLKSLPSQPAHHFVGKQSAGSHCVSEPCNLSKKNITRSVEPDSLSSTCFKTSRGDSRAITGAERNKECRLRLPADLLEPSVNVESNAKTLWAELARYGKEIARISIEETDDLQLLIPLSLLLRLTACCGDDSGPCVGKISTVPRRDITRTPLIYELDPAEVFGCSILESLFRWIVPVTRKFCNSERDITCRECSAKLGTFERARKHQCNTSNGHAKLIRLCLAVLSSVLSIVSEEENIRAENEVSAFFEEAGTDKKIRHTRGLRDPLIDRRRQLAIRIGLTKIIRRDEDSTNLSPYAAFATCVNEKQTHILDAVIFAARILRCDISYVHRPSATVLIRPLNSIVHAFKCWTPGNPMVRSLGT